jgi:hypothetical protein
VGSVALVDGARRRDRLVRGEACDPDRAPIHRLHDELAAAIDEAAVRYWQAFCASIDGMRCKDGMVLEHAAYPNRFH